ncbi:MAG: alpha/beta hydrolase [Limosilactobacillus sp.]|jgi:acetyl esterase/lipase|uniref:alpha/beta hydrolase n=1 Tax=Limosilactobacillus sp. TaxID=2773925 RepID=UPI0025BFC3D4|nr:alpha/beta hydrolase [Limosilactobacillus sp.]MCI1974583.1 alpha/beta hydrolase [Limosilactobacillus sp.]MCI2031651.1 alpha/beta hydrolase [Limosilactobacillus sp.]
MKRLPRFQHHVASEIANNFGQSVCDLVRCGQHRSQRATFVELQIQVSGFKRRMADEQGFRQMLAESQEVSGEDFVMPAVPFTVNLRQLSNAPMRTYVLNEQSGQQKAIIYLPGGAYVEPPVKEQWLFADRLAQQTGARVYVVLYPQLPDHTFKTAYEQLTRLYQQLYEQIPVSDITLLGDSAGGGLAAGFCEYCTERKLPQPGHLVLLSPWLDLDLNNPTIAKYESHDVTLSVKGLRRAADLWADDTKHDDYRLRPLNGDISGLRDVFVCVGTREIMYPDSAQLVQKLRDQHVPVKFVVGRDLPHIFPVYQMPEADRVMVEISKLING